MIGTRPLLHIKTQDKRAFLLHIKTQDKRALKIKDQDLTAEGSSSASMQAQQTEPAVGQDGSGGSGAGAVIGLSAAAGEGGAGDPSGVGVASQGSSHTRWIRRRVQTERISPYKKELLLNLQVNLLPVLKCQ
ncbi:hypothetical protein Tco_0303691 [Tanacetum coccineum]